MLIVKKYGGSSVSTPAKMKAIAESVARAKAQGHQLVIVVSAMGDTTDHLLDLSRAITPTPVQRELDMLLSAGERISMALLSMAINSDGGSAISFTGSQSGVLTDPSHNNARIRDIRPVRLFDELKTGKTIIVAGFQGVNPDNKEVTTLGRGGSDTTAVALAIKLKSQACHIHTDVKGLYSVDPRISETSPIHIPQLDYEGALEMTYWGARVLHYRCVELAERNQMPVIVCLSSPEEGCTNIGPMEHIEFKSVNVLSPVGKLTLPVGHVEEALDILNQAVMSQSIPWPQILYQRLSISGQIEFFISAPPETYAGLAAAVQGMTKKQGLGETHFDAGFSTVSLTGRGFNQTDVASRAALLLKKAGLKSEALIVSPLTFTFVVPLTQAQRAAQVLHKELIES